MKAAVVLGANFGDEGKGHLVDLLAQPGGLVVRHGGGANAGHTVQLQDGRRHVFHHVSSGTFRGADTYLGPEFVVNPLLFLEEWKKLDVRPRVFVHPSCRVTTPWDMLANQRTEEARKENRHGSCGVGLHATKVRSMDFRVHHFLEYDFFLRLEEIEQYYAKKGVELALGSVGAFQRACAAFSQRVEVTDAPPRPQDVPWIFEGSQGLLLDQDHRWFPHVTHARTGLPVVLELERKHRHGARELDVTYVTRAYATRHGAGPLLHEVGDVIGLDATNVPHPFQGTLRYGILDVDLLQESIFRDIRSYPGCTISLAVTCLDHWEDGVIPFYHEKRLQHLSESHFLQLLSREVAPVRYVSRGPCREDWTQL